VVAATNRSLTEEVAAGRFRADLYHRLSVYPLTVPPLRQRAEDVPVLTAFFLDNARHRLGLGPVRLTEQAEHALGAYGWPGNVRELEHLILRAALRASGGHRRVAVLVDVQHLGGLEGTAVVPSPVVAAPAPAAFAPCSLRDATDDLQRRLIVDALREHDGCWSRAAAALQLDRSNLHRLAHRLGVELTPRGAAVVNRNVV
jgi:anaerobic nitric oxide reductase transcription regulator